MQGQARNSWLTTLLLIRTVRMGLCDKRSATALLLCRTAQVPFSPLPRRKWGTVSRDRLEGRNHPSYLHRSISEGLNCSQNGTEPSQITSASYVPCPSSLSCMQQMNASLSDSSACFPVDLNYHVK